MGFLFIVLFLLYFCGLLWQADNKSARNKAEREAMASDCSDETQPFERVIAIIGACALIAIILGSI